MSYVGERPRWPIQSPNKGRKKKDRRLRGERDLIKFTDLRFERMTKIVKRQEEGQSVTNIAQMKENGASQSHPRQCRVK